MECTSAVETAGLLRTLMILTYCLVFQSKDFENRSIFNEVMHRRRSSVNFGGRHFCPKNICENLTRFPNFTWFLPENCPNFMQYFGGGTCPYLPVSYAYGLSEHRCLPLKLWSWVLEWSWDWTVGVNDFYCWVVQWKDLKIGQYFMKLLNSVAFFFGSLGI